MIVIIVGNVVGISLITVGVYVGNVVIADGTSVGVSVIDVG